MPSHFLLSSLRRIAVCLACLPAPLATAAAQGGFPGVSVRTEATSSATFPNIPGPCTQTSAGSLTTGVGGACEVPAPGGAVTFTTGAAGSRADLRLSARAQIVGTTTQARVSYTDRARSVVTDELRVRALAGAPPAADVVFTSFLTGNPVGFAGLDGTWSSAAAVSLFVGEWGGTFQRLNSSFTPLTGFGSFVARIPYMLFASGGGANITLTLETSADVTTGFASGSRSFSAGLVGEHTAGVQSVRVLDASGNDVSAFYEVRTSLGVIPTATVPEPSTFVLLATGMGGLVAWSARRRRSEASLH